MRVLLVQPPFVQLNAPYPAVWYLDAFLRNLGHETRVEDHSIGLWRRIFSRTGISLLFDAAERFEVDRRAAGWQQQVDQAWAPLLHDETTAAQLRRYRSYRPLYEAWIDGLVEFLSDGNPAFAHRLAAAAEFPRGARAEAFLEASGSRPRVEDAPLLATHILEDLVDFATWTVDPALGAGRYGERIAQSQGDFSDIEACIHPPAFGIPRGASPAGVSPAGASPAGASPAGASSAREGALMELFYRPYLRERLAEPLWAADDKPLLLCLTVPFPGCLVGALVCAQEARQAFGQRVRIAMGGGYVSTELRGMTDARIFNYVDYLVFDAGYGALAAILEVESGAPAARLRRTMTRGHDGAVLARGFRAPAGRGGGSASGEDFATATKDTEGDEARLAALEERALRLVHPDYRGLDLSPYLRIVEGGNPMHRLWSDTPWLKHRLAHGCYWRRCAFCDTTLEYVSRYIPADGAALFAAAETAVAGTAAAVETAEGVVSADATCPSGRAGGLHARGPRGGGLRGIHFVDEAMPMAGLLDFARRNRERAAAGKAPFTFWGNARFDASWTADRAGLLAASGLVALSGGIEVASERGLAMTDKGFDLARLVSSLVAIRRSGILVHAYLIYGFPGQDRASILESLEIVRQLFASGLVDSAFWHRFVLTRHSRMESECLAGKRPGLKPIDRGGSFADNDLGFEGEEAWESYGPVLDAALASWMAGEGFERRADSWFAQRVPGGRSRLPAPGLVEDLVTQAEGLLDAASLPAGGTAHWIAGAPVIEPGAAGQEKSATGFSWAWRGTMCDLELPPEDARRLGAAITALSSRPGGMELGEFTATAGLRPEDGALRSLHGAGLVVV